MAVGLTWSALHHSWIAGGIAAGLTVGAVITGRWIVLAIAKTWKRLWEPDARQFDLLKIELAI